MPTTGTTSGTASGSIPAGALDPQRPSGFNPPNPLQALADLFTPKLPELPKMPDIQAEVGPALEGAVQAEVQTREGEHAAALEDQARAEDVAEGVRQDVTDFTTDIDTMMEGLDRDREEWAARADDLEDQLDLLPGQVGAAFDEAMTAFETTSEAALSEVGALHEEAMADVYRGSALAMDAAVQGMHGQVNQAVAQINANPNLTDAQRQQMISQVRMQGAMQIGPAIGATQLQFNTLAANTNTAFGEILGGMQTARMAGVAQIGVAGAQAEAQAFETAAQLGTEMMGIRANADAAYASSQANLMGLRGQAEMTGNELLLNLLPHQETPYVDYTGAANLQLQGTHDLFMSEAAINFGYAGLEMTRAATSAMQGGPLGIIIDIARMIFGGF